MKNYRTSFTVLVIGLTLILAACSTAAPTATITPETNSLPAATAVPVQETTLPAATAEIASTQPAVPASGGSCLTGTWKISDATQLILSAASAINAQGGLVTIGDVSSVSGTAQLIMNADGTATLKADNFNENLTVTVSGQAFPIIVSFNGEESGTYSAAGSNITFSGQAQNTMQETLSVSGNVSNITDDLLNSSNTSSTIPYSCVDANTLNLQLYKSTIMPQPLVLTRVN